MVLPVGNTPATTATDASVGGLGPDAFLKLLVAQMRYQNPMEPNDGSAMLQQTAQFTTVETLKEIAASQQRLMGLQQVTLALDLVGQQVDAIDLYGTPISGIVDQVRFTVDGPMLEIDGVEIPLDNVLSIAGPGTAPTAFPPPPPPAAPPPEPPPDQNTTSAPDPPPIPAGPAPPAAGPAPPTAGPAPAEAPADPQPAAPPAAPPAPEPPPPATPPSPDPAPPPTDDPPARISPGKDPGERN